MEPVPDAGQAFFPLDEQLSLSKGVSLTPKQEEHLVHFAAWMPFACVSKMLERVLGVQVSEATVRRLTERAGDLAQCVQDQGAEPSAVKSNVEKSELEPVVLSADGAFVPLVGGIWAEARTLAIGIPTGQGEQRSTTDLSYFSRCTDAASFTSQCTGEMQRRLVFQSPRVAGVMDGAEWLQNLLDTHVPDAVRILDFPHAAQRVSSIVEAVQQVGLPLPTDALPRSLHLLKHGGPRPVLRWLRHLVRLLPADHSAHEDLAYLSKREGQMQYPDFQAQGWPLGSGCVESANKLVVEARLKGSGMHWARAHVNPMLALRSGVCSNRWEATWNHLSAQRGKQQQQLRKQRASHLLQRATEAFLQQWARMFLLLHHTPAPPTAPSCFQEPAKRVAGRPTSHHPWKRGRACLPAKN